VSSVLAVALAVLAAWAPPEASFTVAIGGDLSLARGIEKRAAKEGWPRVLAPLAAALAGADARLVNLESAAGACLPGGTVQRPRLCGKPEAIAFLPGAGITAVAVANNHALDAGEAGLDETVARLQRENVTVLGAAAVRTGKPAAEILGPVAVIAANLSRSAWPPTSQVPIPTPEELGAVVATARKQDPARPILVLLHGGREMDPEPSSFEHLFAQAALEAGAAAIVFHGAHVLRPLATIAGVPVHLGLGNLLFDQRDPRASRGQVVLLRFRRGRPAEVVEIRGLEATTGARIQWP
jgi:poly-gamma-glutamate synthesis protein (capsule biosynthesis protein)